VLFFFVFFFFQAEDGIRDGHVTGVQTCALPIYEALTMPGIANAWTMPIKARIDMLTTGVRTPLGIKVLGSDLGEIEKVGGQIERSEERRVGKECRSRWSGDE